MQKYIDKLQALVILIEDDKKTVINNSYQMEGEPDDILKTVQDTFKELDFTRVVIQNAIQELNRGN